MGDAFQRRVRKGSDTAEMRCMVYIYTLYTRYVCMKWNGMQVCNNSKPFFLQEVAQNWNKNMVIVLFCTTAPLFYSKSQFDV